MNGASRSRELNGIRLTWQPGSGGRAGRWRKVHKGTVLLYPGGAGPADDEAFGQAVYMHWVDRYEMDRDRPPVTKRPGGWADYQRQLADRHERFVESELRTNGFTTPPLAPTVAPAAETIAEAVESYLSARRQDMAAGLLKPTSYRRLRQQLKHVEAFASGRCVSDLSGQFCVEFRLHLLSLMEAERLGQESARNVLVVTRTWISWLHGSDRLAALPRNLGQMTIPRVVTAPRAFRPDELRKVIDSASDRNRLYLLLMANCGMYGSDIGTLRPDEIDLSAGRIVRRRTKTRNRGAGPVTNYLLWDETLRLLRRFLSGDHERALLSETGTPLWGQRIVPDGKVVETDLVKQAIRRHLARRDLRDVVDGRTAQNIRKTGATLLKDSNEFGDLDGMYLAHAPSGVADRHYSAPPQRRFDRAVIYLGRVLGFATDAARSAAGPRASAAEVLERP